MALITVPGVGNENSNLNLPNIDTDLNDLFSQAFQKLYSASSIQLVGGTDQSAYRMISGDTLFGASLSTAGETGSINFAPKASSYTQELDFMSDNKPLANTDIFSTERQGNLGSSHLNPLAHLNHNGNIHFVDDKHFGSKASPISFHEEHHHGSVEKDHQSHVISFINLDDHDITNF